MGLTKSKNGLTLIETLVVVAVLGLVMVAAMSIFVSMNQIRAKAKALATVREKGSSTTQFLSKNIRNATNIAQEGDDLIITSAMGVSSTISCISGNKLSYTVGASEYDLITQSAHIELSECNLSLTPATSTQPAIAQISFTLVVPGLVDPGEQFGTKIVVRNSKLD